MGSIIAALSSDLSALLDVFKPIAELGGAIADLINIFA